MLASDFDAKEPHYGFSTTPLVEGNVLPAACPNSRLWSTDTATDKPPDLLVPPQVHPCRMAVEPGARSGDH